MFDIIFFKSKNIQQDFRRLKKNNDLERIQMSLDRFRANPQLGGIRKLKNSGPDFRTSEKTV